MTLFRAGTGTLTGTAMAERMISRFPKGLSISSSSAKRIYCRADRAILLELCKYLKEELSFEHVSLVTGVDMMDRIQAVYHLTSYTNSFCLIEIVVDLDRENPEIDSITPLWGGANYHERETYDMLGIVFKGHPDLRRIFLPEDTRFFPLRKDFELRGGP